MKKLILVIAILTCTGCSMPYIQAVDGPYVPVPAQTFVYPAPVPAYYSVQPGSYYNGGYAYYQYNNTVPYYYPRAMYQRPYYPRTVR